MQDSAHDLIIQIKNAYMSGKGTVDVSYSKYKEAVLKKLLALGYIKAYEVEGSVVKRIHVELLYHEGVPTVTGVKLFSKPGRRYYVSYVHLKPVLGGLGSSILSTSKGIMTNKEARKLKVGGELLFEIW